MDFETSLARWRDAQRTCLELRLAYERAYAEALISADGKSSEIRKAQADVSALNALTLYERAAIDARAEEHFLDYLKRSSSSAEAPPRGLARSAVTTDGGAGQA